MLATDGSFDNDAAFMVCPPPDTGELEELFRYEVFKMLKAEGKITDVVIETMMNWGHSGFNLYCGKAIWPPNEDGLENLARGTCPPPESAVLYDECSSPSADDPASLMKLRRTGYLIDVQYPFESYL